MNILFKTYNYHSTKILYILYNLFYRGGENKVNEIIFFLSFLIYITSSYTSFSKMTILLVCISPHCHNLSLLLVSLVLYNSIRDVIQCLEF